jgi:hypothetical protein
VRRVALFLFLFAAVLVSSAAETNYFCVVCGKGPLTGRIWLQPRGAICDYCDKIQDRCTICGLPVGTMPATSKRRIDACLVGNHPMRQTMRALFKS